MTLFTYPIGSMGLIYIYMLHIPSWKLTYPTLGKGKSSTQNTIFGGYVSSLEGILRVYIYIYIYVFSFNHTFGCFLMVICRGPILYTPEIPNMESDLNMIDLEHLQFWCVDPWYLTWGCMEAISPKNGSLGGGWRVTHLTKWCCLSNRIISPGI